MKTSCRLWSVSLAVLASIFSASSSGQTAWLCQTGIENVRVQSPRGAALYDLVYQFRDADEIVGSWGHIFDSANRFYPKQTGPGAVTLRAFAHSGFSVQSGDNLLVTYDGGRQKRVYLPPLTGYVQLYVADDGSTYYDDGLTSPAQAALAPSPTPTPSVMGYKTPSPTPSATPTPVGYFTPTPFPECYCAPQVIPWNVTLTDASPSAVVTYEFLYSGSYRPETVYNWWTSSTDWLDISPPRGLGYDGQNFQLTVSLTDVSGLGPGNTLFIVDFFDELISSGYLYATYAQPSPTPSVGTPLTPKIPTPTPRLPAVTGDYNGDGTSDIALFRPSSGLWLVRGLTKVWFGVSTDFPVPRDYSGNGAWDIAVYRADQSKWMARGVTTAWFGAAVDVPVPGDYDGNGTADLAVFRPSIGKWAVRGVTQAYYGVSSDHLVPGNYAGDPRTQIAVWRSSTGRWLVKDLTTLYYGGPTDGPVPGPYSGGLTWDYAVYRYNQGKWLVRDLTTVYYGNSTDTVQPADYDGDGTWDLAVFRSSSGKWLVRGVTAPYYGASTDRPATNP